MNKPDKAGEPSIEEILASIRRKSSEGPAASQSVGGEPPVAPSVEPLGASVPPPPREAPPALLDRLNGMARSEAATGSGDAQAGASNGAKRPVSFDQDLADMFDEPGPAAASPAAPKPEVRPAPDFGSLTPQPPAETGKALPAAAATSGFGVPSLRVAPAPFGSGFGTADASAQAPKPPAYGFPPLTKRGGFFPRSEPQLPPMPAAGPGDAAPSSTESPSLPTNRDSAAPAASGDSPRISDLGSLVPAAATGHGIHTPRSSFGSPPLGGSGSDTLSRDPLNGSGADGATTNGTAVNGAARVLPELNAPSHDAPVPSVASSGFVAPSLKIPGTDFVPASIPTSGAAPAAPSTPHANGGPSSSANPFASSPAVERAPVAEAPKPLVADKNLALSGKSDTAATQALDALAMGLAASSPASSQAKPEPRLAAPSPDVSPKPPLKPTPEGYAVEAPASSAVGVPASSPASRTLEDVISDMLRPMLHNWVQENMPRIMEKALRSEMQRTLGQGGKPPGSAS